MRERDRRQMLDERSGILQIRGLEPSRELSVNRAQQSQGFVVAALAFPNTGKITCRPQLPAKRSLAPSKLYTSEEQTSDVIERRAAPCQ